MSNTTVSNGTSGMLPEPEPPVPHRRRRPWGLIAGGFFLLVATFGAGLWFSGVGEELVERPFCAFAPGSARETESAISVDDGPMFPSEGEIFFTTVSVRSLSIWEEFWARRDNTIQVVDEEVGNCNNSEAREINQIQMDTSIDSARRLAFASLGFELEPKAVQILSVSLEAPAGEFLRPGELIVGVGDSPVVVPDDLTELLADNQAGDEVTLQVEALDGEVTDRPITLIANPCTEEQIAEGCDPDRALIGISVQQGVEFPFDVDIDAGRVGGPSAGLAFTLALIDFLSEGELTGGQRVAVTGTIEPDGSVGLVGGVTQKTFASIEEDVDVFIVPAEQFDTAAAVAGDDLIIESAATLEEALEVLARLGGDPVELALTEG